MRNKDKYKEFCGNNDSIPVFSKAWWLDAVCGTNCWDVILIEKNNEIIASFPYCIQTRRGFKFIGMPSLTQTLGPYVKYPENQSISKRLSYEKKIMSDIISQLPAFDMFNQQFHYNVTNWLPFYWAGFKQTTRYTYVIEDLKDLDVVFNNFDRAKKKNIKKASKLVNVKFDLSAQEFYDNHQMTLMKQGKTIEYSFEVFNNLYNSCYENNSGRVIYAEDSSGVIHAALFVVWDSDSAYDLISTIDPDTRNSGAASMLTWEMIKFTSEFVNKFDFEGSMIESVENSFRQFGASQKSYFAIKKIDSKIIKLGVLVKKIFR